MLRPREPNFFFSSFGHDALLHIEKIVSSNFLCAFLEDKHMVKLCSKLIGYFL
jgi:hypothetical protein